MTGANGVERLRRVLKDTWRFSILIVVTNPGPTREWLIEQLRVWSEVGVVAPMRVLRPPPGEHLWQVIHGSGAERDAREGVVLTDLEAFVSGGHVASELVELNIVRNQLRQVLGGPLVLVVGEEVAVALAKGLPDFYSWRATECVIDDETALRWRSSRLPTEVRLPPYPSVQAPLGSRSMNERWIASPHKTQHVYIVAAEYANEDFDAPNAVMKAHSPRRADAGRRSTGQLMEAASLNAIANLPNPRCVTHLHGITMPDKRFSTGELNQFYGLKPKLRLGDRCEMRMETGTSDSGAVALASAWQLLRGAQEPGTALVLAAQAFEPETNPREFVAEVIDEEERRAGLNMIPMGDLTMDALVHWAAGASTVRGWLGDPLKTDAFLAQWCEVKLRLASEYHPSQRDTARDRVPKDLQARWLRTSHIAQASAGACAVVLTTDPAVVEHTLRRSSSPSARVVRIVGVGEGDAPISVGQRDESINFFRAFRQAFSELRRSSGRTIDHLRAASFGVLHDAFPSIEMAALVSLGLSPIDIEQRVQSYWTNPYGGLLGMGHAFAASGLVQAAKAYHTMLRPSRFFRSTIEGSHHPEFQAAHGPLHALTLSVGGPMSHAVAMLVESVAHTPGETPEGASGATARAPAWESPVPLPPRHTLAAVDQVPFEQKVLWVGELNRAYARGLHEASARDLTDGARYGVLEARTLLRLDSVLASMLPLFRAPTDWTTPADTRWGETSIPLFTLKSDLLKVLSAPWTHEGSDKERDDALRDQLKRRVHAEAEAALARKSKGVEPPRKDVHACANHLLVALGIPMGYAMIGEIGTTKPIHRMCVLAYDPPTKEPQIGDLLELTETRPSLATPSSRRYLGLIPPWLGVATTAGTVRWGHETLTALESAQKALRSPQPRTSLELLYAAARHAIQDVAAHPKRTPPVAFRTLLRDLVLNPDEDWDVLRGAVQALRPDQEAPPRRPVTMHCVFDLLDARKEPDLEGLKRRLDTVSQAIRRAEAWLGGTTPVHSRQGDLFAVSAAVSGSSWALRWHPALSFARSVYQECLERGVAVRGVVALGEGVPVASIDGDQPAPVSRVAFAVDTVVERAGSREFSKYFYGSAREGILAVLDAATAKDMADELSEAPGDHATQAFDAIWKIVGGEQLPVVDAKAGAARARFGTIPGEGPMPTVYYQLRARPAPDRAEPLTPSQVMENPIAAARAVLQELFDSRKKVERFAMDHGMGPILPRVDLTGAPEEFWHEILEVMMQGAIPTHEGSGAVLMLLQRASEEFPSNRRIAALIRLLQEQEPPSRPSVPPKP